MNIEVKKLEELSSLELYELLRLRTDVFVVEQKCAYPEVDFHDKIASHVLAWQDDKLVACARILPPGSNYPEASIGRVAVHQELRGKELGKKVFKSALKKAIELYPQENVKVQAQCYLEKFYQDFGFKTISKPYPDVGIMHVDMILQP